MSLLDKINFCNNGKSRETYIPFFVEDQRVGWIHQEFVAVLKSYSELFLQKENSISISTFYSQYETRTSAVDKVLRKLYTEKRFTGWRNEPYPVSAGFFDKPFFEMERAAVPYFGVRAYGVHLNGYVRDNDEILMWIAKRADNKPTYPGKLDNMVAGGLPLGIGVLENLIKEASEEAALPTEFSSKVKPVGVISYCHEENSCLKPDLIFVFDIELPHDFVPNNIDGEVSEFKLLPAKQVLSITSDTSDFKFNCAAVNIDFFIRKGILTPEDYDYTNIVRALYGG